MAAILQRELYVDWNKADSPKEEQLEAHEHASMATAVPIHGTLDREDRSFQAYGACNGTDPDMFFPNRGESLEPAKSVCAKCVVREECLEYALANGERYGVWGGTSERERRRLRRARHLGGSAVGAA